MRIDFHTHILPEMDDGAKNIEQAVEILRKEKSDGIDVIIATPHFYCKKNTVESFLERRNKSFDLLMKNINQKDFPKIILGAEVYYSSSLNEIDVEKLCIEGTSCLLLELPYDHYTSFLINNIITFIGMNDFTIVLAHIERYLDLSGIENILDMNSDNLFAQVNCGSIIDRETRKKVLKLIKNGYAQVLGTDVHNTSTRSVCFFEAEKIIRKKLSDKKFEEMMECSENMLEL